MASAGENRLSCSTSDSDPHGQKRARLLRAVSEPDTGAWISTEETSTTESYGKRHPFVGKCHHGALPVPITIRLPCYLRMKACLSKRHWKC